MITKDFKMKRKTDIEKIVGLAEKSLKMVMVTASDEVMKNLGLTKSKGRILEFHITYANGETEDLAFYYASKAATEHNPDWPAIEVRLHMNDDKTSRLAIGEWKEGTDKEVINEIREYAEAFYEGAKEKHITNVSVDICG